MQLTKIFMEPDHFSEYCMRHSGIILLQLLTIRKQWKSYYHNRGQSYYLIFHINHTNTEINSSNVALRYIKTLIIYFGISFTLYLQKSSCMNSRNEDILNYFVIIVLKNMCEFFIKKKNNINPIHIPMRR